MRLRSSQFVFLLLIACSVQMREDHALRWAEQAISGNSVRTLAQQKVVEVARPSFSAGRQAQHRDALSLAPAALTVRRAPWTMRRPAADSTAVAAYTGLLRA